MVMTEKDIRKLIRESIGSLDESRMVTNSFDLMSKISRNIPGLKKLGIQAMSDGMAGLFRYELDGNVYEIQIRPAARIEDKDFWGNVIKKTEPNPMKDVYKLLNKKQD